MVVPSLPLPPFCRASGDFHDGRMRLSFSTCGRYSAHMIRIAHWSNYVVLCQPHAWTRFSRHLSALHYTCYPNIFHFLDLLLLSKTRDVRKRTRYAATSNNALCCVFAFGCSQGRLSLVSFFFSNILSFLMFYLFPFCLEVKGLRSWGFYHSINSIIQPYLK